MDSVTCPIPNSVLNPQESVEVFEGNKTTVCDDVPEDASYWFKEMVGRIVNENLADHDTSQWSSKKIKVGTSSVEHSKQIQSHPEYGGSYLADTNLAIFFEHQQQNTGQRHYFFQRSDENNDLERAHTFNYESCWEHHYSGLTVHRICWIIHTLFYQSSRYVDTLEIMRKCGGLVGVFVRKLHSG